LARFGWRASQDGPAGVGQLRCGVADKATTCRLTALGFRCF
jgi:hypothetical protein